MGLTASMIALKGARLETLVAELYMAHLNGPLFELNTASQAKLEAFADWLVDVAGETGLDLVRWSGAFRAPAGPLGCFSVMPTVMDADLELVFMEKLMKLDLSIIGQNWDRVREILGDLWSSHIDGGAFGLTRENERRFFEFADWLDGVMATLKVDRRWDPSDFRVSFDEMAEVYPSMREGGC